MNFNGNYLFFMSTLYYSLVHQWKNIQNYNVQARTKDEVKKKTNGESDVEKRKSLQPPNEFCMFRFTEKKARIHVYVEYLYNLLYFNKSIYMYYSRIYQHVTSLTYFTKFLHHLTFHSSLRERAHAHTHAYYFNKNRRRVGEKFHSKCLISCSNRFGRQ